MTTPTELEDTIADWIESVSGRPCLFQDKVGPTSPVNYCLVHFRLLDPLPWDVVTIDKDDCITETVRGLCRVTIAIGVVGGNDTLTVANRLRNSIQSSQRWTDLWTVMGKGATGDIIDLTAQYRGKLRSRHEFTIMGETTLSDDFTYDWFDQVEVTTNVSDLEETFTVGTDIPPEHLDQSGC